MSAGTSCFDEFLEESNKMSIMIFTKESIAVDSVGNKNSTEITKYEGKWNVSLKKLNFEFMIISTILV